MPGSYLASKKSRTPLSAVFCNSSRYFIKFKIVRASVLCLYMLAQGGFGCHLKQIVVFFSSLYFMNASVKHIWMFSMKNGLF